MPITWNPGSTQAGAFSLSSRKQDEGTSEG